MPRGTAATRRRCCRRSRGMRAWTKRQRRPSWRPCVSRPSRSSSPRSGSAAPSRPYLKGVADVFVQAGGIDAALPTYENAVNPAPAEGRRRHVALRVGPGQRAPDPILFGNGAVMSDLIIDKVSMRFDLPSGDSVQALEDINLSIEGGEIMAVLVLPGAARRRCSTLSPGSSPRPREPCRSGGTPVTEPGPSAEWCSSRAPCSNG